MPPEGSTRVLIVGATSAIAAETARAYAARGARLYLAARHPDRLAAVAADLRVRGAAAVETALLDATDHRRCEEVVEAAWATFGGLDVALIAHGVLPDQASGQRSATEALRSIDVNFGSAVALLTPLANRFEAARSGCIAVISSVAGDRGRQSNYVYGSAKGGLDRFLQGLRNRLYQAGVAVVTLKPGFVDTPMTSHLPKNPLFASPRRVGRAIHRAIERRRNVVYIPWFWRPIMGLIAALPEAVFKRLRM
jgi:decaprenylphospho-beta-D-erythro-pentofuranosid-2-ulose 2-reductase